MASQNQMIYSNFAANGPIAVTTAETVVATTRAISSPYPGASYALEFLGELLIGTGGLTATYQIRRGSLTGTSVATSGARTVVAGQTILFAFSAVDTIAGDVASQLWVCTIAIASASANTNSGSIFTKITTGV